MFAASNPELFKACFLAWISDLGSPPVPMTLAIHEAEPGITSRTGDQFYDVPIIAAALASGRTTLFAKDVQDGQVIDGRPTIRDPFRIPGVMRIGPAPSRNSVSWRTRIVLSPWHA
jgi:hypothetical protein